MSTMDKFRFAGTAALLTYRTHIDKDQYRKWFTSTFGAIKCLFIAHETGTSTGVEYDHTHVLFRLERKIDKKNCKVFDFQELHPNINPKNPHNFTEWNNALKYLMKDDEDCAEEIREFVPAERVSKIWKSKSIQEAVTRNVQSLNDVRSIIELYKIRPTTVVKPELTLRPIQQSICNVIDNTNDGRSVIWVYDKIGGVGKSMLARYLCVGEPDKYALAKNCTSMKDFATVYKNALQRGWTGYCMLFDLTRSVQDYDGGLYSCIEAALDGVVTATKYDSDTFFGVPSKVVVLANFLPKLQRLSLDRWLVYEAKDGTLNIKSAIPEEESDDENIFLRRE